MKRLLLRAIAANRLDFDYDSTLREDIAFGFQPLQRFFDEEEKEPEEGHVLRVQRRQMGIAGIAGKSLTGETPTISVIGNRSISSGPSAIGGEAI